MGSSASNSVGFTPQIGVEPSVNVSISLPTPAPQQIDTNRLPAQATDTGLEITPIFLLAGIGAIGFIMMSKKRL